VTQVHMRNGSISGQRVTNATLNMHHNYMDATTFGDSYPVHVPTTRELTGEFDITLSHDSDKFLDWLRSCFHAPIYQRALGPGNRCQYCNTVWLPGTFKCPSCGGTIQYDSRVMEWDGSKAIITNFDITNNVYDILQVHLEVLYVEELDVMSRLWNNLDRLLTHSLAREPGTWLCDFCGLYVIGTSSKCPGCGGNRLPIKEIAKLERYCIYCNKVVVGGWACPECNMRLMRHTNAYQV
jgi:hypothetical protein